LNGKTSVTVGCTALICTSVLIWSSRLASYFTGAGLTSTSLRGGACVIGGTEMCVMTPPGLSTRNDLKRTSPPIRSNTRSTSLMAVLKSVLV
jgi:hypothetical protein